ncbi:MAG TPA: hypothetical protein VM097_04885 [Mycobacteriales bacterium]|nr:hypothetical protein [Mycobacteriales bacterium]
MGDEELLREVSEKLRLAHARVAALQASSEEKSSTTRRLLVISDAAKHDVTRAAQRLDAFLAELDVQHPAS